MAKNQKHTDVCDCCSTHEHHEHHHEHDHAHHHEHHHEHDHAHHHSDSCACCAEHHHDDGCGCGHDHNHENIDKKAFAKKIGFGIFFFVVGILLEKLTPQMTSAGIFAEYPQIVSYISLVSFGLSYIIVGFSILREAVEGIIKGNIFNENFLMAIASLGAFAIQEYSEGCAVVLLYTVGEFLQSLAVSKSRNSIRSMLEQKPEAVNVLRDGVLTEAKPEEVATGELIVVKPGEKIHLDGVITDGTAEVDMAALTGESIPVSMSVGDEVLSGSVNIDGALTIQVTKPYSESTVARILSMLESAQDKKSHAEKFITRFARIYTPIVCLIALGIILIPPLFFGGEWQEWIYRGLSALVVSCPCAIVISIPLSFFGGLGTCSKEGILVKGSNYLELLAKCNVGVFDKTGTITSGKFEFVRCECYHCHCEDSEHRALLRIIAACEEYSTHPIAKSICLAFGQFADDCVVTDAKNYAGMGVSAVVDGVKYYVGNEKLMAQAGVDFKETELIGTAVYCCSETEFLGDIVFADIIKEDSKDALADLHSLGMKKTVMLTGDKEPIAKDIADKAGLDAYYAKLLPEQKVEKMEQLRQDGSVVLYTGDGINDAPVLAAADLGIAMGGVGSDVAIEASDMVIMGDSLSKIPQGIRIARKTVSIARQNIIFSIAVKLLIILGCAVGIFDENAMWLAVFGDVGVCLIAVANSLRVMHVKKKSK